MAPNTRVTTTNMTFGFESRLGVLADVPFDPTARLTDDNHR